MALREPLTRAGEAGTLEQAVAGVLAAAAHLGRRLGEACARHGITHEQYDVLRLLREAHPLGQPRCDILARLVDRSPDVTRLLDRLERVGLVERVRGTTDRRLSIARITPVGLEVLESVEPGIQAVYGSLAAKLGEADARRLAELCGALLP